MTNTVILNIFTPMNTIEKSVKSQSKVHNNCGQIVAKFSTIMFAYYAQVLVDKNKLSTIMFAYYTQVIMDKNYHILSTVLWLSGKSTRLWSYCGRFVHNIYQSVGSMFCYKRYKGVRGSRGPGVG